MIKPILQQITGEEFDMRFANTEDGTRLDVKARAMSIFDVRVAHLNASSNGSQPTEEILLSRENKKTQVLQCKSYGNRVNGFYTMQ